MIKMDLQIVNINNLFYTRNVINDLSQQTSEFDLTVVDQGSKEQGTQEYLDSLVLKGIKVIQNKENVPLNYLWNKFYMESKSPYICFLNNDVRIPSNFVEDTINVFDKEDGVGAVIHSTNHPRFQKTTDLKYIILGGPFAQGWDFTLRKEAYVPIPDDLKFFGGDDWLFNKLWYNGWKTAVVLSSPIIHFYAKSRRHYRGNREMEASALRAHGIGRIPYMCPYSKRSPRFFEIGETKGDGHE